MAKEREIYKRLRKQTNQITIILGLGVLIDTLIITMELLQLHYFVAFLFAYIGGLKLFLIYVIRTSGKQWEDMSKLQNKTMTLYSKNHKRWLKLYSKLESEYAKK